MARWALATVPDLPAPEVRFYETATTTDIDRRLRGLARVRARWDAILGYCGHAVKQSQLHSRLGFASFRHYCDERLGVSARGVALAAQHAGQFGHAVAVSEPPHLGGGAAGPHLFGDAEVRVRRQAARAG